MKQIHLILDEDNGSGAEARVGVASGRGGRGLLWPGSPVSSGRLLARALRRGVVVCVVLLVASFSFFLVTSSQRSGFYTRVIFTFHQAPEYIMDAMVPSINASLSTSHSSFTKNTGGGTDVGDSEGNSSEEDQKGFLVRTPGCIIPDFDPFHHTITRFISNPINLVCKGPPAITSATGTTLYYHQDVLREHLDHFLNIYERKLASPTSNTTTTKISHPPSTIRTGDNIPPTRPSNVSSHARPSDSSPSGAVSEDAAQRADVDVYTDASGNSSSTDGAPPSPSPDDVSCCYRAIYRVEQKPEEYNGAADDRWRYSALCEPLTGAETTIHEEAVLVHCRMSNIVVYKNVHYFIQRARLLATPPATRDSNSSSTAGNQTVVDRAEHHNTTGTHGEDDAAPPTPTTTTDHIQPDDAEKLSVIIFGTDSASRLNMRRHLPKTYKYLTEELGAVDLAGYNKVGDNTFPNLVPVLSGLSSDELVNHTCIPKKEKFDHCHWIWKDFKKKGYVTAFLEDSPWMGLFNYMRNGFVTKPTDYYGRPFFMASEQEIGNSKHGNSNACQGSKLSMKVVQEYSLDMARAFLDTPTFGMYWSASISHDYLNMLRHADLPHLQYLRQLREMGALNHTAIFFMSDHGMRFGSIRSTYVGMLEERLPYVLLYFPPWFRAKYHRALQNLRVNVRRLTANFDLYQTLNDLVFGRFANLTHVTSKPSPRTRGISLFQEIPRSRRCVDAGIPEHFCTCQDTREVTLDDPVLGLTADHLKATLNQDLAQYPCLHQVVRVVTGRVSGSNKQLSPEDTSSDVRSYLVQAALYPGGVMVEATVRYNPYPELFQIAGEVSRINEYGNSSSCIHHSILRKFCFCKDHLTSQQHSLDDQPQQNQSQTEAGGRSVPTS
ncbi:uncharacterized protein [Panulirus ornatus]|uniref:uncharacterized protein n=1 Tax=Panulirus ornatus TaxID=150431 RepID=UPI003A86627E